MRPTLVLAPLMLAMACLLPSLTRAEQGHDASARIIYLVRHGHYDADPDADRDLGPGISALGVAQSKLLGSRLSGLPTFDQLYVSPMQRAQDTAAALSGSLTDPRFDTLVDLRECTPPTWRDVVTADQSPQQLARCAEQLERLFRAHFRPAANAPSQELMVCHGNVIRYLITRALGVDSKAWLEMSVSHASITRIRIEADGSYKLVGAGDVGHLPPNMHTGATGDADWDLVVPALP